MLRNDMEKGLKKSVRKFIFNSPECEKVHKIVWPCCAYLSSRIGRYKVTSEMSIDEVKKLVEKVTKENGN